MSTIGGGVSVSVTSPLKKDPRISGKYEASSASLTVATGSSGVTAAATGTSFFSCLTSGGSSQVTVPVNISAGVNLVDVLNDGGFVNCIILPEFAVAGGVWAMDVIVDGVTRTISGIVPSLGSRVVIMFSNCALLHDVETGTPTVDGQTFIVSGMRIPSIGGAIARGECLRFDNSLKITLRSTVAVIASATLNKAIVHLRLDSTYD